MKKFLTIIVAGFLIVTLLDQLIGRGLEKFFSSATVGEQGHLNHVLKDVDAPILVFGTSKALHHYVPQVIVDSTGMECYNCGFEAQGIMTNYALIRCITQRYQPQLIIYDLDYHYDIEYAPYTNNVVNVRRMSKLTIRDSLLNAIDPWAHLRMKSRIYPYNSALIELVLNRFQNSTYDNPEADRGYIPQHNVLDQDAIDNWNPPIATDTLRLNLIANLIERYHDRLIFFSSPTYQHQPRLDQMYATVKKLAEPYDVPIYVLGNDSIFMDKPELWDDIRHLNDDGARIYTAKVAHLVKLWLKTHPGDK
ncbi:MAG: hypothetical protein J6S96_03975 [Muribaculaceae bacterium]|nr:hypothetical protein [Muribaculaceae bacterium]